MKRVNILHCVLIKYFITTGCLKSKTAAGPTVIKITSMDYEVYGFLGVLFTKYTKEEADRLGIRGWVKNTAQGTVVGYIEGPKEEVKAMMKWLRKTGSPRSEIEKVEFRGRKTNNRDFAYDDFTILRDCL